MYKIKEYEDKYDKKVNSFIISIFVEEYGFEEYRKELEEQCYSEYMEQNGKLWIAIDEDENVVGTIAIKQHNENEAELKRLYVRKDYRGKGLSNELYENLIMQAKENNLKRIFLGTYEKLESAIKFYKKRGFTQIEELDDELNGARYFELYV